jgi:hypothetical protein
VACELLKESQEVVVFLCFFSFKLLQRENLGLGMAIFQGQAGVRIMVQSSGQHEQCM